MKGLLATPRLKIHLSMLSAAGALGNCSRLAPPDATLNRFWKPYKKNLSMDLKTETFIVSSVVVLVRNVIRCKTKHLLLRKRRTFRFASTHQPWANYDLFRFQLRPCTVQPAAHMRRSRAASQYLPLRGSKCQTKKRRDRFWIRRADIDTSKDGNARTTSRMAGRSESATSKQ